MERVDPSRKSSEDVRRMFDAIAPRYDLLNRVLSAGVDRRWRRRTVERTLDGFARAQAHVLDVCCGTGDLSRAFALDARVRRVVGLDFAPRMVELARTKREPAKADSRAPTSFALADALRLPVASSSFDVVAIAFGLRNLVDPRAGLFEMRRATRPGGRVAVLEFFAPQAGAAASCFDLYFRHVLPRVGRWLTRSAPFDAYRYLPDSVAAFATPTELERWCGEAGLEDVRGESFLFGAVRLVSGRVPAAAPARRDRERVACLV